MIAAAQTRERVVDAAVVKLMTGNVSNAELREVRDLLAPVARNADEPEWVREALATAVQLLEQIGRGQATSESTLPRVHSLLELVSTGETPQEAASSTTLALPLEAAREILPQFAAESLDCVAQAESALLELESNPANAEAVNLVFRSFHTIKSTAAFLGLEAISALAHDLESLLCEVRDGRAEFTRRIADLSLASADMMRTLLNGVEALLDGAALEIPAGYQALLQQLHAATTDSTQPSQTQDRVAPAEPAPSPRASKATSDAWVRIRTERMDQLLDLVGELVVAQAMVAQDDVVQRERHGTLARKVQQTGKLVRELQTVSLSLRMVPLRALFQKMQRLVRDLAVSADKPVQLITEGEDTEIDRNMVEVLTDPLVHMIRNAVDHGIENATARAAAGKPATGTLRLKAMHAGGSVVVELSDDGGGLDEDHIVAAATEKRIIEPGTTLSPAEIHELIFHPGLSTRGEVTELSGRGVGMDVVRRNIEALRGRVEIASDRGHGTTFTIRLPLTLAITDGMLVRVGTERYIVPTGEIHTSFRPVREQLVTVGSDAELVMLHGQPLPIVRLHRVLDVDNAETDPTRALLVVLGQNDKRYALLVDDLLGQQQFVAKPVTGGLALLPGIAGGAILGDGCVGLILDPAGVFSAARRHPSN